VTASEYFAQEAMVIYFRNFYLK